MHHSTLLAFAIPIFALLSCSSPQTTENSRGTEDPKEEVFLFSYFVGNGEDGLHFAYSEDGYTWEALAEGASFLAPTAGED